MYKIYKAKIHEKSVYTYYVLCNECIEMSRFYHDSSKYCTYVSGIYNLEVEIDLYSKYSNYLVDCIYESPSLQEATNYLEQLRTLLSV